MKKVALLLIVIINCLTTQIFAITAQDFITDIEKTSSQPLIPKEIRQKFNYTKKFARYKAESKKGNLVATYKLAYFYYHGITTLRNRPLAIKLYKEVTQKATGKLQGFALLRLAEIDFDKSLPLQQFKGEEMVKVLNLAIDKGAVDAYKLLAQVYLKGRGVSKNKQKFIEYLKIGREKNSGAAYAESLKNYRLINNHTLYQKFSKHDEKKFNEYVEKAFELKNANGFKQKMLFYIMPVIPTDDSGNIIRNKKLKRRSDFFKGKDLLLKALTKDITHYDCIKIAYRLLCFSDELVQFNAKQLIRELIEIDQNNFYALLQLARIYIYYGKDKKEIVKGLKILNFLDKKGFVPAKLQLASFYGTDQVLGLNYIIKFKRNEYKQMNYLKDLAANFNEGFDSLAMIYFEKSSRLPSLEKTAVNHLQKAFKYNQISNQLLEFLPQIYGVPIDSINKYYLIKNNQKNKKYGKKVIALLEEYLQSFPYSTKAMISLSELYNKEKMYNKCQQILEKIYEIEPNGAENLIIFYLKSAKSRPENIVKAKELTEFLMANSDYHHHTIFSVLQNFNQFHKQSLPYFIEKIKQESQSNDRLFFTLINCYNHGLGVEKNINKAIELLDEKIVETNDSTWQRAILCYYAPLHSNTDYYFNVARKNNPQKYFYHLDKLINNLNQKEIHFPFNFYNYAKCFILGYGTEQNFVKAQEIFNKYSNYMSEFEEVEKLLETPPEKIKNLNQRIKELTKKKSLDKFSDQRAILEILKYKQTLLKK
ncbi:hypothetical protein AAEX28_01185 [Lentisphaerota bacterium WC36G]|nr:hypothetical protein LJT99_04065 [Lentisphaerae bacterium WC36]